MTPALAIYTNFKTYEVVNSNVVVIINRNIIYKI
jgi:hypothetical protein